MHYWPRREGADPLSYGADARIAAPHLRAVKKEEWTVWSRKRPSHRTPRKDRSGHLEDSNEKKVYSPQLCEDIAAEAVDCVRAAFRGDGDASPEQHALPSELQRFLVLDHTEEQGVHMQPDFGRGNGPKGIEKEDSRQQMVLASRMPNLRPSHGRSRRSLSPIACMRPTTFDLRK